MTSCKAYARTTGRQCTNPPMTGQQVCRMHGGASKQARQAAEQRLAQAEADGILAAYDRADDVDPGEALIDLICWGHAKVGYYRSRVQALDDQDMVWGLTKTATGGKEAGDTYEAKPNVWVGLLREAEQDLARYCVDALKVGLKQRELDIAARMADKIVPILDAVLAEFGHDPAEPDVAQRVERVLRAA